MRIDDIYFQKICCSSVRPPISIAIYKFFFRYVCKYREASEKRTRIRRKKKRNISFTSSIPAGRIESSHVRMLEKVRRKWDKRIKVLYNRGRKVICWESCVEIAGKIDTESFS